MSDDDVRARELLALPFDDDAVSIRPEVYCQSCAEGSCWHGHKVEVCAKCGALVSTEHVHVEYIPHEHVRARLDQVDPNWSCVPAAIDGNGMPLLDQGCVWVRLTVAGKTVYGVGDGHGGKGNGRHRQTAFTFAFKHAAEQLGVGRYLRLRERERPPVELPAEKAADPVALVDDAATKEHLIKRIVDRGTRKGMSAAGIESDFGNWSQTLDMPNGVRLHEATAEQMKNYLELLGGKA